MIRNFFIFIKYNIINFKYKFIMHRKNPLGGKSNITKKKIKK